LAIVFPQGRLPLDINNMTVCRLVDDFREKRWMQGAFFLESVFRKEKE
jgi:hypothetical protein